MKIYKQMTILYKILGIVVILNCLSCQNRNSISPELIPTVSPLQSTIPVSQFDQFISDVRYIKVGDGSEKGVFKIKKIQFVNDEVMIVQSHRGVSHVDIRGNHIKDFGNPGKGPGEYLSVRDFYISSDKNSVGILDPYESLHFYRISDGQFIKTIKPTWSVSAPTADDICPAKNNGFFLFRPQSANDKKFSNDFYCLTEFNEKGKIREEYIKREDFIYNIPIFTQGVDDNYFIRITEGSNLLRYIKDGVVTSLFKVDFGKKGVPPKLIYELNKNPWNAISEYAQAPYYKFYNNFRETENQLYFSCFNANLENESFLFNKEGMNGIRWISDNSFKFMNSINNRFVLCLEDSIKDSQDHLDPLKEYILDNLPHDINPVEYPVLCMIKFRIDEE